MSAPCSRSARGVQLAVGELERRHPSPRGRRRACRSGGRRSRRRRASTGVTSPQRVSSGPSTLTEARMRSTSSYGATGHQLAAVGQHQPIRAGALARDTDRRQQLAHDRHVDEVGHVGELVHAVGEQAGRHQLEHRVLGAGHVDPSGQRPAVLDGIVPPAAVANGSVTGAPSSRAESWRWPTAMVHR